MNDIPLNKRINEISKKNSKEKTKTVLETIDAPWSEYEVSDKCIKYKVQTKIELKINEIKKEFTDEELEYFNIKQVTSFLEDLI